MNECQVLISLGMMSDIFGVAQQSVHRWNSSVARPGSRLPAPDIQAGSTPLWFEDTIREWAATRRRKLTVDETVMDRIRQSQRTV